jgi:hypothetical protein
MACELYACIFGFGWSGWVALFLLTPLFGCEGIWYDESLLGGMAMEVEVMTCGDERRGDLYVWLLRGVLGREGGGG